jgi:hypothetical protein
MPYIAVPGFPGAIRSLLHNLLCAIFHANACSRPPLPSIRIFILQLLWCKGKKGIIKRGMNQGLISKIKV